MIAHPLRIGIYGVSGVGKSTLARALGTYANAVACVDGSAVIEETCPGGLSGFKRMDADGKYRARETAVRRIQTFFETQNKHVVVAGHYSFLKDDGFEIAWTGADSAFYDLIIHLECDTDTHRQRCQADQSRRRNFNEADLNRWHRFERERLAQLCALENRPFLTINSGLPLDEQVKSVLEIVSRVSLSKAAEAISCSHRKAVVLDCDGTLNNDDVLNYAPVPQLSVDNITRIFKRFPGYCFDAFYAVSQHIDTHVARRDVLQMLDRARAALRLNPAIARALDELNEKHRSHQPIAQIGVSCGFTLGWRNCLSDRAYWLGGASFDLFGCILSDAGKGHFVRELKRHGVEVTCFGNSSSDLPMLREADNSFYVHNGRPNERHLEKLRAHLSLTLLQLEHQDACHDTLQADPVS